MVKFDDVSIIDDLTEEEGGPVDFCSDKGYEKGYSLFIRSEQSGDIFEVIISENELKFMLKEIEEKL